MKNLKIEWAPPLFTQLFYWVVLFFFFCSRSADPLVCIWEKKEPEEESKQGRKKKDKQQEEGEEPDEKKKEIAEEEEEEEEEKLVIDLLLCLRLKFFAYKPYVGVPYLQSKVLRLSDLSFCLSVCLWGLDFFTVVVEVLNSSCLSLKERI